MPLLLPSRLFAVGLMTAVLTVCLAPPAFAVDDDPHGGVETGTHPSGELHDSYGGAGEGPVVRDPGTLVVHESSPTDENLDVYPDTEDKVPGVFRSQLPGMTTREIDGYAHAAGRAKSDGSTGGDKKSGDPESFKNSRSGKKDAGKPVVINVFRPGSDHDSFDAVTIANPRDLEQLAKIEPITSKGSDGVSQTFAYLISFHETLTSTPADVAKAIFRLTGGVFSSCLVNGNAYVCTFATPKTIRVTQSPLTIPPVDLSIRQIPICSGVVKDGGYGRPTVISVADVDCEAAPGKEPIRLEVDTIYSDVALGIPTSRIGDGAIAYETTPDAAGTYVSAEVWAVAADGTYSLPFSIAIRNRYSPTEAASAAAAPVEAVRGVDTVVPAATIFRDDDIDRYAAESGDHLSSGVTEQGAMGGAWFDAAGSLHYRSIDVIRGEYTDHVTVRTTDAFGLPSPEVRLSIHITDIVPGCASGGTTTDANTPTRIQLWCWITPLDGWRQIEGMQYRLTQEPEFGTVSDFDPVAGTLTYTPDPGHPGSVGIGFSAENNGATRAASYSVNVLSAP